MLFYDWKSHIFEAISVKFTQYVPLPLCVGDAVERDDGDVDDAETDILEKEENAKMLRVKINIYIVEICVWMWKGREKVVGCLCIETR